MNIDIKKNQHGGILLSRKKEQMFSYPEGFEKYFKRNVAFLIIWFIIIIIYSVDF